MQSTSIPADPISTFSLSAFRLNGLLMRNGDQITKALGQSSARWHILGRAGHQPQTVAQMARSLGNARQSVQRIANDLVREGLAEYKENPADRRSPIVVLTPQGERVLAAIYERYDAWAKRIITQLNKDQLMRLAAELEAVSDIIEKDITKGD